MVLNPESKFSKQIRTKNSCIFLNAKCLRNWKAPAAAHSIIDTHHFAFVQQLSDHLPFMSLRYLAPRESTCQF